MLPNPPSTHKPQTLEFIKVLAPTAVAVVAAFQKSGPQFWALVGIAVLVFVAAFWEPVGRRVGAWRRRQHDDRVARRVIPELKRLVRQFEDLIDESRSTDTLRRIIDNAFQSNQQTLARLKLPGAHSLVSLCWQLRERLEDPSDLQHLLRSGGEFHTIVNAYDDTTLRPIFKDLQAEDRELVLRACGSKVEAFRQRYMTFRNDYEKFVKTVLAELRTLPQPQFYGDYPRADPLTG